jgi:hypothetical protein
MKLTRLKCSEKKRLVRQEPPCHSVKELAALDKNRQGKVAKNRGIP